MKIQKAYQFTKELLGDHISNMVMLVFVILCALFLIDSIFSLILFGVPILFLAALEIVIIRRECWEFDLLLEESEEIRCNLSWIVNNVVVGRTKQEAEISP